MNFWKINRPCLLNRETGKESLLDYVLLDLYEPFFQVHNAERIKFVRHWSAKAATSVSKLPSHYRVNYFPGNDENLALWLKGDRFFSRNDAEFSGGHKKLVTFTQKLYTTIRCLASLLVMPCYSGGLFLYKQRNWLVCFFFHNQSDYKGRKLLPDDSFSKVL